MQGPRHVSEELAEPTLLNTVPTTVPVSVQLEQKRKEKADQGTSSLRVPGR